jgi:hypothetical protein
VSTGAAATQALFEHVRDVERPASVPVVGQVPIAGAHVPPQLVVLPQSVPSRAVVASTGQVGFRPSHCSGASQGPAEPRHSMLDPRMLHTPSVPARLQAWQSVIEPPPQAPLQQTPSTQLPVRHSFPVPQARPSGFFAAQSVPEQ